VRQKGQRRQPATEGLPVRSSMRTAGLARVCGCASRKEKARIRPLGGHRDLRPSVRIASWRQGQPKSRAAQCIKKAGGDNRQPL
jgi:hypothetical protein